ncbi:MAG: methyl-accepting chemotaxis protein [Spirochaetales bacterium]
MKMRTKITFGFASVLALLAVVGVVSVIYMQQAATGFTQYRGWARDANLVNEMQESLLMARMNVKDYLIRGTRQEQLGFEEYYEESRGYLEEAQTAIQNTQRAEWVDEIDTRLGAYGDFFRDVVGYQAVRDEHYEVLNQVGPQIERDLTAILTSASQDNEMDDAYTASMAMRSLLIARIYAMRFLEDNLEESEQRVLQELETMEGHLQTLDAALQNSTRRSHYQAAASGTETYLNSFRPLAQAIYDRNEIVTNRLDVIGPEIAALAQQIIDSVTLDQDTLGPELQAKIQMAVILVIVVSVAAILIGLFLALMITKSILNQLGEDPQVIERIAQQIAAGDLEIKTVDNAKGVYQSVQEMVESLRYKGKLLEQMAMKDLTVDIRKASDRDSLGESMTVMRDSLRDVLLGVRTAVEQVAAGSGQVSSASQDLSQGATESASSLEEISSSVNQVNGQARQNADNATEANGIAKQAAENATSGNEQMSQLKDAMANISHSSDEIKKVVKVIDDIAFQINLLALNANVEAARAGKYGKGFAVVAEEVRNLAVRSADAVQETTAMVDESVRNIETGNGLTDKTAEQLTEILTGASKVAEFLEEIAAASKEQALAIEQVTDGLTQVDQVTQSNTASAEESASAAEELASQAEELRASIADFKLGNDATASRLAAPSSNGNGQKHEFRSAEPAQQEKRREPVAVGAAHRSNGNGSTSERPEEVIKLDDDEFDRF